MKLSHLLWSPVKEGETWALTFVRVAGNLIRWIVIFPAVLLAIGLGIYAVYLWNDSRPVELNEMRDVVIGMSPDDVTVAKGAPGFRGEPETNDNGQTEIVMTYDDVFIFFVGEDENSLKVYRVCDTNPPSYPSYNGVTGYSSDERVREHLGEPDSERIHDDKLGKGLWYDRWNMIVHLEAGNVEAICIGA